MAEQTAVDWAIIETGTVETPQGLDVYLIKEEAADGLRDYHSFPMETLEWRAAEYNIDPNDFDTLIDIIAHEPYLDDPSDPANVRTDPAAARGYVSSAVEPRQGVSPLELVPTTLMNAEDPDLARGALLERIAHAKATRARVAHPTGKNDPCARLCTAWISFADPAEVEAKRVVVERTRRQLAISARQRAERGETGYPLRARKDRVQTLESSNA